MYIHIDTYTYIYIYIYINCVENSIICIHQILHAKHEHMHPLRYTCTCTCALCIALFHTHAHTYTHSPHASCRDSLCAVRCIHLHVLICIHRSHTPTNTPPPYAHTRRFTTVDLDHYLTLFTNLYSTNLLLNALFLQRKEGGKRGAWQ